MRLAPHHHLVRQHCAVRRDERGGLSCSTKATGRPQALSRRNTLDVVALASRPLSGMMSCLAPSPAVMSSLEMTVTRSAAFDRVNFLGLALGHQGAERVFGGYLDVHGRRSIYRFNEKTILRSGAARANELNGLSTLEQVPLKARGGAASRPYCMDFNWAFLLLPRDSKALYGFQNPIRSGPQRSIRAGSRP